jgi:RNA polymerase sigma-70 factor (ECF subfamily)
MIAAVAGDDFDRLYEEHAQRLFAFLVYRTGNRALAEDLLADTFEAAYRARRRFDPRRASQATWLYAIARNRLIDHQRRRRSEVSALGRVAGGLGEGASDHGIETIGDRDALHRALAKLSDEEREAVALRFGAGLTLKHIARVLGEPMTTVEGRVYRALRKLRDELGGDV